MYRRPKFLEVLFRIREEMAREADYDTDLFAEIVRSGQTRGKRVSHSMADAQLDEQKPKSKRTRAV